MASENQNLQDAFLNQTRKTKTPVTVFLINGVKLQGIISWFDTFCILFSVRPWGGCKIIHPFKVAAQACIFWTL